VHLPPPHEALPCHVPARRANRPGASASRSHQPGRYGRKTITPAHCTTPLVVQPATDARLSSGVLRKRPGGGSPNGKRGSPAPAGHHRPARRNAAPRDRGRPAWDLHPHGWAGSVSSATMLKPARCVDGWNCPTGAPLLASKASNGPRNLGLKALVAGTTCAKQKNSLHQPGLTPGHPPTHGDCRFSFATVRLFADTAPHRDAEPHRPTLGWKALNHNSAGRAASSNRSGAIPNSHWSANPVAAHPVKMMGAPYAQSTPTEPILRA